MSYVFTVSPDFTPDHLSGWYIFNTWLQRKTGEAIHLEMYDTFQKQRDAINQDQIDLIYANPFDAAMLVREKGFSPLVKPQGDSDEALIAANAESENRSVEDLKPGTRIAGTDDPDVLMMGLIMLEPADLNKSNITLIDSDTYITVAKHLLRGEADAGIFLAEAFDDLSGVVKNQLRILVRSQISVIHHSLMIGPKLAEKRTAIQNELLNMLEDEKGKGVLESLGFKSWQVVDDEEMEFMIDLIDTLMK
ncbi:MAG: phosphate/phosphite/phosphonate ABC transporter substrate-binding protein [Gammaproteobacteria bacterium]